MTCPTPPPPVNLDPRNRDPVNQTLGLEKTQDRDALSGRMEAEGSQNSEELPPPAQSPPPPPSPRFPLSPETPELPEPKAPTEVEARQLLLEEWGPLSGKLELPPSLSWRLLFLERPLYRNLLSSPNPEGGDAAGDTWSAAQTLGLFIFLCVLRLSLHVCVSVSLSYSVYGLGASLTLSLSLASACVSVPFSRFRLELQRLTITAHRPP